MIRYAHASWTDPVESRRLWLTHAHAVLTRPQSDPELTDEEFFVIERIFGRRDVSALLDGIGFDCVEDGDSLITMYGAGAPNTDLMIRLIQMNLNDDRSSVLAVNLHVADVPEDVSSGPPKLWCFEVSAKKVKTHTVSKDSTGKAYKYEA